MKLAQITLHRLYHQECTRGYTNGLGDTLLPDSPSLPSSTLRPPGWLYALSLCSARVRGGCVHVCTQMCTRVYTDVYRRVHCCIHTCTHLRSRYVPEERDIDLAKSLTILAIRTSRGGPNRRSARGSLGSSPSA